MNLKPWFYGAVLLMGLGLVAGVKLSGLRWRFNIESVAVEEEEEKQEYEVYQLKPGSMDDGETLRVERNSEELKIKLCEINAPEEEEELGRESREHLRSLAVINNGELWLIPIEKDKEGSTVAEVYVRDSYDTAINLNVQMVRDGYAWHDEGDSNTCPIRGEFALAQELAQEEGLGIWKGR